MEVTWIRSLCVREKKMNSTQLFFDGGEFRLFDANPLAPLLGHRALQFELGLLHCLDLLSHRLGLRVVSGTNGKVKGIGMENERRVV